MLAKLTEPVEHSDWVDKLSQVEFAINNSVHCTTKQSPSRLLFGTEQRGLIVDELAEYLRRTYCDESMNLDNIRESAAKAIRKSQSYNLNYFNNHHKPPKSFKVGDYVVLKNVDTTA